MLQSLSNAALAFSNCVIKIYVHGFVVTEGAMMSKFCLLSQQYMGHTVEFRWSVDKRDW